MTQKLTRRLLCATAVALLLGSSPGWSQSRDVDESFSAVAMTNNNLGAAAGRVLIDISRWSTREESVKLAEKLREGGPQAMLTELRGAQQTGTIRTPETPGYALHYAHQTTDAQGNRRIVLITDRPISFEGQFEPVELKYPFTVVQLQIGPDGTGTGTLAYAAQLEANNDTIIVENFGTGRTKLTEVRAES
jgi:hypothetical protein